MQKEYLDNLINLICNEEYEYRNYRGEKSKTKIISKSDQEALRALEKVIYEWGASISNEEIIHELGMLRAKCYTYEQIIAKSNFAPMIISVTPVDEISDSVYRNDGNLANLINEIERGEDDKRPRDSAEDY